eukprot:Rmarinus@m.24159
MNIFLFTHCHRQPSDKRRQQQRRRRLIVFCLFVIFCVPPSTSIYSKPINIDSKTSTSTTTTTTTTGLTMTTTTDQPLRKTRWATDTPMPCTEGLREDWTFPQWMYALVLTASRWILTKDSQWERTCDLAPMELKRTMTVTTPLKAQIHHRSPERVSG